MRRFLNLKKDISTVEDVNYPPLPEEVSYSQMIYMTKRGFIAKKIATYIEIDQELSNKIFFHSFSKENYGKTLMDNNHYKQYLYFSECLLRWEADRDDIKQRVDELPIDNRIKNALLKVYEIHIKNINRDDAFEEKSISFDDKWQIYRDVLFSVTQGKFQLIDGQELAQYKAATKLVEAEIKKLSDIPKCRNEVKELLESLNYNKSQLMSKLLVISEAITNTLKHAEEGKMTLVEDSKTNELYIIVEDKGPGFHLETLPKTALMAGYSTKKSLGQGFQLMFKMSKQVLLYSSKQGSTIILKFDAEKNGE